MKKALSISAGYRRAAGMGINIDVPSFHLPLEGTGRRRLPVVYPTGGICLATSAFQRGSSNSTLNLEDLSLHQ